MDWKKIGRGVLRDTKITVITSLITRVVLEWFNNENKENNNE
jgi:hypothetical protein